MRGILVTLFSVTALVGAATVNTLGCHTNPSEASAICRAAGSEGALVAHEKCNKFYQCSHGKPIALKCPNDLLYNPELEYCDWPKDVDCGNRTQPGHGDNNKNSDETDEDKDDFDNSGHDDPSQAPDICARPGSDGALIAHEHCTKFYKCYRGRPIALRCPPLLHYNPKIQKCDWPRNVDCGNRLIHVEDDSNESDNSHGGESSDSDEDNDSGHDDGHKDEGHPDPSQAPKICAKNDSDGVLVAHEFCNHFYICLHGRPFPNICPRGLLFDPKGRVCDWPKNVDCGNRIIPKENDTDTDHEDDKQEIYNDPSKAPEICAEHESVLVAHEYCNYFYQCAGGKPVARRCPAGLVYNYYKIECDWPKNVKCGKRIIKEDKDVEEPEDVTEKHVAGHDDPSKAPAICAKKGSDDVLVAHEYCNQFYICAAGVPVARPCPKGLLYNPKKERCDWPDNVTCGGRIPPVDEDCGEDKDDEDHGEHEGNNDPSKAPEICAEEGSDGVLIAHEYCHKFYICVNGHPVSRECPKHLLFNPRKNECDWPENVRCWGRIPREKRSASVNEEIRSHYDITSYSHSSEARRICSKEESDGILVAHEHCNKFYQCVSHQPIAMHCPSVLRFSPKEQYCDWSENVDCGNRIIPEKKDDGETDESDEDEVIGNNFDDPSQAPLICAKEDSDGIHVAHNYCNKFYICVNNRPFALACPGNLWYNPKIERCDWRQNVHCNGRLIA